MCPYAFSPHPLPASTSIRIWFFKEDMTDKNRKQRYRIKKLLYKAIGKCWIKTPRRALGLRLHFLTVRGRFICIIVTVWIAHFLYFVFVLQQTCEKYFMAYVRLQLNLPPPPIWASTLLAGPPLPAWAYALYGWPLSACGQAYPENISIIYLKWKFDFIYVRTQKFKQFVSIMMKCWLPLIYASFFS